MSAIREKRGRHDNDENNYCWSSRTSFSTDRVSFVMCCNIVLVIPNIINILHVVVYYCYEIRAADPRDPHDLIRSIRVMRWVCTRCAGWPRVDEPEKSYYFVYVLCTRTGIVLHVLILHLFVHNYYLLFGICIGISGIHYRIGYLLNNCTYKFIISYKFISIYLNNLITERYNVIQAYFSNFREKWKINFIHFITSKY